MSLRLRTEAAKDLLRRYAGIFSHCWRNRRQLDGNVLKAEEAEFLPAALSLVERPVSPCARLVAKVFITLLAVLIIWSIVGKIDIIVNASGKIIPGGYTKTIACVDTASVRALYVREGQRVKAGDTLIELDTDISDAERDKAAGEHDMSTLEAEAARALIAAIDSGRPPQLKRLPDVPEDKLNTVRQSLTARYSDFMARLKVIDGEIVRLTQELRLATQQASDYADLLKDRDVSQHAWLEKEHARVELEGRLVGAKNQRTALIAETRRTAHDHWTQESRVGAAARQDELRAAAHSRLLTLIAPVDGTIQQLSVHTIGGVVPAAQPLMQIVPDNAKVEVEAFIENKDVGFVEEDQDVEVKIDAFEFTKYGTVKGKVTHISRDAIPDEKIGLIYSTKIALEKSVINVKGKEAQLSPGMSVRVEIKTGDRRIIEYVLSPVLRHKRETLNER